MPELLGLFTLLDTYIHVLEFKLISNMYTFEIHISFIRKNSLQKHIYEQFNPKRLLAN